MLDKLGSAITGPRMRWVVVVLWIVAAAVLSLTLPAVGGQEQNNAPNLPPDSPSVLADQWMKENFPSSSGIPALVVWHREGGLIQEDYLLIQRVTEQIANQPLESQGEIIPMHLIPLPGLLQFASEDGSTLVQPIPFASHTETELLKQNMEQLKHIVQDASLMDPFAAAIDSEAELSARISGPVGISIDATDLFKGADFVLLMATVLLVLILLLLIYRSPILAIIPIIGVGFAYAVTSPLLGWMAERGWITVDGQSISIMTVLLFGAGTDYCLFLITRFRQELTVEANRGIAIRHAFKGASGAIAMSGFTVVLALFSLLVARYGAYERFAVPFSLSILIMGIASLTLVPALLSIIGRASFYPFVPRTEQMARERAEKRGKTYRKSGRDQRLGAKIGQLVIHRPWTVVITCLLTLGLLASFAPHIKYTYDLMSSFPKDMPSREGYDVIASSFTPGELAPVTIIVQTDGLPVDLAAKLKELPIVDHVEEPQTSAADPNLLAYQVMLNTNPYSSEAMAAIPLLREQAESALSSSQADHPGEKVWIGGQTAAQYDTQQLTERDNSVIMPLVIGLIMLLLLLYLRSVTATVYLIATVLLSFVAALGLGWIILHEVMGFDAIQGAIPLYAFVFLIALGEDYNIFMISSIWQKRKEMPLRQAIKEGVSETGSVITSAGIILAATFSVLATLPIQVLLQFGLITAIGVLMDTFIVRPFLVPAITALLGKRAFWPAKPEWIEESPSTHKQRV